jgi:peroxin-13
MISVAEQFSSLRQTLGSLLGIFTVLRWLRTLFAKVTGRPPPADATSLTPSEFFSQFPSLGNGAQLGPEGQQAKPKPSKKPFIVFLLAVVGMPYLMGKLIRAVSKSQEEQQLLAQQQGQITYDPATGQPIPPQQAPIDPNTLTFCKALYDFPPPDAVAAGTFVPGELDLVVKKGDLVAVLDKTDIDSQGGTNAEGDWWRCRARDGRTGYLPKVYLEVVIRKEKGSEAGSRANTMPGSVGSAATLVGGAGSRTQSLNDKKREELELGVGGFQKAWVPGQ